MDLNYLLMREQIERARADRSGCSPARTAHARLADLYRERIDLGRRTLFADARPEPNPRLPRL